MKSVNVTKNVPPSCPMTPAPIFRTGCGVVCGTTGLGLPAAASVTLGLAVCSLVPLSLCCVHAGIALNTTSTCIITISLTTPIVTQIHHHLLLLLLA